MSNPIRATKAANAQSETTQKAQVLTNSQAATQTATPQDKVIISEPAKPALANKTKPAAKR